ncbi:putative integral membrane protein [Arthrobacter pascens]|uniref:LapA family protein n=1 Tax=Arthrobacter pascens TaxID=1677 RepID=UPI0027896BE4|nr:lipopolysaccharide assembly protein LapA domain-containing protein [Arthrobacter pascens]MDQ0635883.1 putative integral membrane protein [Arthrobacter pascens]
MSTGNVTPAGGEERRMVPGAQASDPHLTASAPIASGPAAAPAAPSAAAPPAPALPAAEQRVTRAGVVWAAVVAALVLLILLIIFIMQNQEQVAIRYLGMEGSVPLGMALFIASVTGGVLVAISGGARILQLRYNAHRSRLRQPRS